MATFITQGTAMWAFLNKPSPNFNKNGYEWTITLEVAAPEAKKLKEQGLNVRDRDGVLSVVFKQPVERKDGTKNNPPVIVDSHNMPYEGPGIGNGSKVRVKYRTYDWEFGRKKGVGCALAAVQVIDLVPYEGSGPEEDFEEVNNESPF